MAEDREVLKEVWNGRLPACIRLAPEDDDSVTPPDPYYIMLPRLSYLSIATDKVKKHFSKFVSTNKCDSEMWFDFEGAPLKWHLPIGVLYDQLERDCKLDTDPLGPPWALTAHFGNLPSEEILKCDTKESVESLFMSCIKEADQIKHSGRIVSAMQKKDHNQLWQGLLNDKFDQFWAVNRRLMEVSVLSNQPEAGASQPTTVETTDGFRSFKNIPIRLYSKDKLLAQKLVKPTKNVEHGGERPTTLGDLLVDYYSHSNIDSMTVVTQGINLEADVPLQWLAEHLSYPDNFLHMCLK